MKETGEQLIVMSKRVFLLIIVTSFFTALALGYAVGYFTKPAKEIYIQKTTDTEKNILSSESKVDEVKPQEKQEVPIVQEVEAKEEKFTDQSRQIQHETVKKERRHYSRTQKYTIQIGAFNERQNASRLINKLKKERISAYIIKEDFYKVRVGYYKSFKDAKRVSNKLKSLGMENFVIKIKEGSHS